ncbi:hypothetical protein D9M70_633810 [compost metagenome]
MCAILVYKFTTSHHACQPASSSRTENAQWLLTTMTSYVKQKCKDTENEPAGLFKHGKHQPVPRC